MPKIEGGIVFKQGKPLPQKFIDSMGGKEGMIEKVGIKLGKKAAKKKGSKKK